MIDIPKRATDLLREVEKLRKNRPESKEWTQPIYDTLNYVVYGRRCGWIIDNFPDLGKT